MDKEPFQSLVDTHCHILPGIDDGAADNSVSLEMATIAVADGISTVIATPHIVEGLNESEDMQGRIDGLQVLIDEEGIDLELLPGAELPMSLCLGGQVDTLSSLSLAGSDYLLMETADTGFEQLRWASYQVRLAGLYPVLAHPERVPFVMEDPGTLVELTGSGDIFCQLTANSFEGLFGKTVRRTAEGLLRSGACHLIASDAHSIGKRSPRLAAAYEIISNMVGTNAAEIIFRENPASIVAGEMLTNPDIDGRNSRSSGLWQSLRRHR